MNDPLRGGPSVRRTMLRRRLRVGLLAVVRGPAVLAVAAAGLALVLVAPVAVFLLGVIVNRLLGPRNDTGYTLLALGGDVLVARYGVPWSLVGVRQLAGVTRRLSQSWLGVRIPDPYLPRSPGDLPKGVAQGITRMLNDPATWRDLLWMVVNAAVGWVLAMAPAALFGVGVVALVDSVGAPFPALMATGASHTVLAGAGAHLDASARLLRRLLEAGLFGAGALLLSVWVAPVLFRAYFGLASSLLGPRGDVEMALRVQHLAQTRAESVDTSAAEIRRIERDLHDGTQARLVAMGMTLSAARDLLDTDQEATRRLLTDAVDASAKALAELRALIRGIHPPVLADRGLVDAVRALALDAALPVQVDADVHRRPSPPVESAAYFAVSELLANASKHSGAQQVRVGIGHPNGKLCIEVADDGRGGVDASRGTGLRGIERRLAVFDGELTISSPAGGPTAIRMEIPCEL